MQVIRIIRGSSDLLLMILTALQGPIFCLRLPLYRSLDESGASMELSDFGMDVNQLHYCLACPCRSNVQSLESPEGIRDSK